jgi:tetratricopeptide (TPR) repeat protein
MRGGIGNADAERNPPDPAPPPATGKSPSRTQSSTPTRTRAFFRTVADLGIQAAEAIEHAHGLGVVHRDIKPANLLIDHRGTLWITDFGLARLRNDSGLTMTGDLMGTLRYMSPEQAMGRGVDIDHRTDIYSLGVTLYELLTRKPAITGQDRQEVLRQIAHEEPTPPRRLEPAISRELETIILKAMAKEPEGRYATAQELADDLRRFLDHKPIRARRPTLLERATKWSRRHRWAVVSAMVVLCLALSGLTFALAVIWREQGRTEHERRRLATNLTLALKALDEVVLPFVEDELPRDPRREAKDRVLLEKALGFYEEFARSNADDPSLRRERARAYRRAGKLWGGLGRLSEAENAYRQAIQLQEEQITLEPNRDGLLQELVRSAMGLGFVLRTSGQRLREAEGVLKNAANQLGHLSTDPPSAPEPRELRAAIHNELSLVYQDGGRLVEAEEARVRSTQLYRNLANEFPAQPKYRARLAHSYMETAVQRTIIKPVTSGEEREHTKALNAAGESLREALNLLQVLVDELPGDTGYRNDLAQAFGRYGTVLRELRNYPESRAAYEKARDLYRALAGEYPALAVYRQNLSACLTNLGNTLSDEGRVQEAGPLHDQAIAIKEKLASDFPEIMDNRSQLGACLNNRANTVQDKAEACRLLRRAIAHQRAALEAQPRNPTYRRFLRYHWLNLISRLFELGDHRECSKAAAEFARISPEPTRDAFFAAAYLARCAAQAEGDSALSRDARGELARSYAGRARDVLRAGGDWAPDDAELLNNVAWLFVSGPDPRLYEPARALGLAERATKLNPRESAYWHNLGAARYRLGDARGAIEAIERAMSQRTDGSPNDWLMLAMAYQKLGEKDRSIGWCGRAIERLKNTSWDNDEPDRLLDEATALLGLAELPDDVFARP